MYDYFDEDGPNTRVTPYGELDYMEQIVQWLYDLISIAHAPAIFLPITLLGGIALLVPVGIFGLRRWRVERELIEADIVDVLARTQLYALLVAENFAISIRRSNKQYLLESIERWTAQRYQRWTEFQLYLAVRYVDDLQRRTVNEDLVLERLTRALRNISLAQFGDSRMGIGLAIINNGIASIGGMRPSHQSAVAMNPDSEASSPSEALDVRESIELMSSHSDPYELEETLLRKFRDHPLQRLNQLLRAIEVEALKQGFVRCDCSNCLLAEMVLWIVHEEQIGPVRLPAHIRELREVSVQLVPQLPSFLREKPIRAVERFSANELRVTFARAELPLANEQEFACHFGIAMRFDNELWKARSIEFCIVNAIAVLTFAPARTNQAERAIQPHPLFKSTFHLP